MERNTLIDQEQFELKIKQLNSQIEDEKRRVESLNIVINNLENREAQLNGFSLAFYNS